MYIRERCERKIRWRGLDIRRDRSGLHRVPSGEVGAVGSFIREEKMIELPAVERDLPLKEPSALADAELAVSAPLLRNRQGGITRVCSWL